jgi:hypothetical protein
LSKSDKHFDHLKVTASGVRPVSAVAVINPMPGALASRWLVALSR